MSARSKARKRALDVLYAAEARDSDIHSVLAERIADSDAVPLGDFAEGLVQDVAAHLGRVDDIISQHAIGWTLERMPAVDRAILRLAIAEMLYSEPIDAAIVIDEAVELAKSLSTDASPRFINGLLAQVAAIAPQLRAAN